QKPGSTAWYNTGVTAESYTVMGSLNNGYRYRARVSNGSRTLDSSAATLSVQPMARGSSS
ncbi:MAG: hypothetical protein II379_05460, partial [Oscillospiraceae bacterium]|nr:hypothetical protein [Oscillospiraceae bacterium]